jgi:hypothetical protein
MKKLHKVVMLSSLLLCLYSGMSIGKKDHKGDCHASASYSKAACSACCGTEQHLGQSYSKKKGCYCQH